MWINVIVNGKIRIGDIIKILISKKYYASNKQSLKQSAIFLNREIDQSHPFDEKDNYNIRVCLLYNRDRVRKKKSVSHMYYTMYNKDLEKINSISDFIKALNAWETKYIY